MGVMTVSLDEKIEKRFRRKVKEKYGNKKGVLGKGLNEALLKWIEDDEQKRIAEEMIALMEKGFDMGPIKYTSRDELHRRGL